MALNIPPSPLRYQMFTMRDGLPADFLSDYDLCIQALYQEMNGPESSPFSPERSRRLAVQEAATALACTLMPAIEPVTLVSIQPRQNSPLGQTVVRTNEQRQYAELWTRRYLEEQLVTVLAGAKSLLSNAPHSTRPPPPPPGGRAGALFLRAGITLASHV